MEISAALGSLIFPQVGIGILYFGLLGAFFAFFCTAPPLRLAARRGLGELVVGLSFGPLAVVGTVFALTGSVATIDFLAGVPIGLLTVAILWINEFPDIESDLAAGKANLVATLGRERARYGYVILMIAAFGLAIYWTLVGDDPFPIGASLILGAAPMAYKAAKVLMVEYAERSLVRANASTIQLYMIGDLLMAVGLFLSGTISNLLGL